MRSKSLTLLRKISSLSLVVICSLVFAGSVVSNAQGQDKDNNKPKVSEGEAKGAKAISSAPDAAAKLAAAAEFVKKYPKSSLRSEVSSYVLGQIDKVGDGTQKLALAETFQKTFTGDKEQEAIQAIILDAYFAAKRTDDAFTLAASILAKQPEHVVVLSRMLIAGTDEAKRQNPKYIGQSQQYGLKAIELIEANKKPADITDAAWENHKTLLPALYQNMGILSLVSGNSAEAKTRLEKAVTLNPAEPFNYVLLGSIANDEYQQLATSHKAMPNGPQKDEALKKATAMMDKVIDLYAHAVGATDGKPEYTQVHDQLMQDLTPYYKYRHNQSTEGLQQLIDKYKVPANP
jgi:tetratricopeptide (TPR) repeat protein